MVEATLRNVAPGVSYQAVTASRGKQVRAEPIAALYEQGKVHHVGTHARLEDQMCEWSPMTDAYSPDRVDAAVWGLTALKLGRSSDPIFPVGFRSPKRRI
jgi:phage terminase large subunit-like protein